MRFDAGMDRVGFEIGLSIQHLAFINEMYVENIEQMQLTTKRTTD